MNEVILSAAVAAYARSIRSTASRLSLYDERSWIELLSTSTPPTVATMTEAYLRKRRARRAAILAIGRACSKTRAPYIHTEPLNRNCVDAAGRREDSLSGRGRAMRQQEPTLCAMFTW